MHTFDLTPLYRTSIGFDRLAQMIDTINVDLNLKIRNISKNLNFLRKSSISINIKLIHLI